MEDKIIKNMEDKIIKREEELKEMELEDLEAISGGGWREVCTPEELKRYKELYDEEYRLWKVSRKYMRPKELEAYLAAKEATQEYVYMMIAKYGQ